MPDGLVRRYELSHHYENAVTCMFRYFGFFRQEQGHQSADYLQQPGEAVTDPDARVADLVAEAARRRDVQRGRRKRLDHARAYGLAARHAAKLAHLRHHHDDPDPDDGPEAA